MPKIVYTGKKRGNGCGRGFLFQCHQDYMPECHKIDQPKYKRIRSKEFPETSLNEKLNLHIQAVHSKKALEWIG